MVYRVFYMSWAPPAWREHILQAQPPGFETIWRESEVEDPAEIAAGLADADFIVTGTINAAQIAQIGRARLIQTSGVGYDRMDVAAANARGIPVAISPESTGVGVSEHTVMLILALLKHLREADQALREGRWLRNHLRPICRMLEGQRVGIVGLGRIGKEVARRLHAFGVDLVYHDIHRPDPAEEQALHVTYLPLDDLLRTVDVLTLHVFLGPGARHIIGEREIGLMKDGAVFVNTCRGAVVDQDALYRALVSGKLAAAGLDVFAQEPVPLDDPILKLDNVILTPHVATNNREAMVAKAHACYGNMLRVIRGEPPRNVVQPYELVVAGNGVR